MSRFFSALALVIFLVSLPITTAAVWIRFQILDSDAYVNAVGPVIEDRHVRDDLEAELTRQLDAVLTDLIARFPAEAETLLSEIGGVDAARDLIARAAAAIIESDAFSEIWVESNRISHDLIVDALAGRGSGIGLTANGSVAIDANLFLSALGEGADNELTQFAEQLTSASPNLEIVVFRAPELVWVERFVKFNLPITLAALVVTVSSAVIAFALARHRARTAIIAGLGAAIVMLVFLGLVFTQLSDHLESVRDPAANELVVDYSAALLASLLLSALTLAIAGVAVMLVGTGFTLVGRRRHAGSGAASAR